MTTVRDHYEGLLAEHYTWMFDTSFADKVGAQADLLHDMGVQAPELAVDLGCGSGFQSVALAKMGAQVHAVDLSRTLLAELQTRAADLPIRTHESDLLAFELPEGERADVVICMGDTLTHLSSDEAVAQLMHRAAAMLAPGGRLVLSWRDLSSPLRGLDRFIPLRSDDTRILTCFVEDAGDTIRVHDLLHLRGPEGWTLHRSAYDKLKLAQDTVVAMAEAAGLRVVHNETRSGLSLLSAVQ